MGVAIQVSTSRSLSETKGEAFGLPSEAILKRLKISREVAWYLVSRGIPFPDCPPIVKTPEGRGAKGAVFDPEAVDRVLLCFSYLRHTQGRLAGQPLNPDPWQVAYIIAPVFGWVRLNNHGDWVRVVRTLYVDVPRKNGKSTIAGGLALYLTGADNEPGAQVVAAASTKDQAGFVFKPIKALVEKAPALRGKFRPLAGRILHPRSDSYFGVISSAAEAQHGANLHGAIIDELHIHRTPDLVETLETGTGSREQPLICFITTADAGKPNTIYARKRKQIEQLARNVFKDPTTFGVIFAVPAAADPFKEATWKAANPGYPISPTQGYLESAANRAKNSPAELAAFKRLHLGIRTKQMTEYIGLPEWDRNAGKKVEESILYGREVFGGLDLGSVSDLTALCWLAPYTDGRAGYDVFFRFWTPADNLEALDKRTSNSASMWVKDGYLTLTPGNVTDYDYIEEQIREDAANFRLTSIGFDYWNATQVANHMMDEGINVVEVRQGFKSLSPPLKEAKRLLMQGTTKDPRIHHGGNPVMRWMTDNLAVDMDKSGNVRPDKASAGDKIDGWSALVNALSEALNTTAQRSAYDDDDHDLVIA